MNHLDGAEKKEKALFRAFDRDVYFVFFHVATPQQVHAPKVKQGPFESENQTSHSAWP